MADKITKIERPVKLQRAFMSASMAQLLASLQPLPSYSQQDDEELNVIQVLVYPDHEHAVASFVTAIGTFIALLDNSLASQLGKALKRKHSYGKRQTFHSARLSTSDVDVIRVCLLHHSRVDSVTLTFTTRVATVSVILSASFAGQMGAGLFALAAPHQPQQHH